MNATSYSDFLLQAQWSRRLFAALACCALSTNAAALDPSRGLSRAVDELANASSAQQLRFVDAAVEELAKAHRQLSAEAGGAAPRWAGSTRNFNSRLQAAAAAAHRGAAVRILAEADGTVRVVVGSQPARQFMITAPTAGGGATLERAILRRFCRDDGCGRAPGRKRAAERATTQAIARTLFARPTHGLAPTPATPVSDRQATIRSDRAALVAALPPGDDGLRCRADLAPHARLYASACRELTREIRALAAAVHAAARRGVHIAWPMIALPPRRNPSDKLVFNDHGDEVVLALPALARAPELRAQLVPWLQERLAGHPSELPFEPPSRLVYAVR